MKKKIKKILKFIAYTTAFTAIYNKTVAILATAHNHLKATRGQFFIWDYGKVFYEKRGEGSPVLLLHDLTASSCGYEWSKIVDKLAENHTVYIPDLLGCGRSEKPGFTYSNFLYVKFLSAFLDEEIAAPCTIITSGNSSSFALLGSKFSSDLVKDVICINPADPHGYDQSKSFKDKVFNTVLSIPIYGTLAYNHFLSQRKIQKLFNEHYFYMENDEITKHVQVYHEAAHHKLRFARNFLAAERLNFCVLPVKQILSNMNFSVKLIFGAEEERAEEIADLYKGYDSNISIDFIAETKHLPHLEKAEEILELL